MQRLEKGMGSPKPELIAAVAPEQPEEYIEPELEEEVNAEPAQAKTETDGLNQAAEEEHDK